MLLAVGRSIALAGDPQELFAAACRALVEDGPFLATSVGLLEAETGTVTQVARAGDRTDAHPREFPLTVQGRPRGVLTVHAPTQHFFGPDDIDVMEDVAATIAHVWTALDRQAVLRQSNEVLTQALHQTVVGSALADLAGRYLQVNPALSSMLGYTQEELLQLTVEATLAADAADRLSRLIAEGGERAPLEMDGYVVRRDGTVLWVRTIASVLHGLDGKPACVFIQLQPSEQRPPAEEEDLQPDRQVAIASLVQKAMGDVKLEALFREALVAVREGLSVELADVFELSREGGTLKLRTEAGWNTGRVGAAEVPTDALSQGGYALTSTSPVIVEDLTTEHRFVPSPLLLQQGALSGMSTAITVWARPYGLLSAHTRKRRVFGKEDAHFLQVVANVLAAGIERDQREERMRHQATHDELTGLANRALLMDRLDLALLRLRRSGQPLAVLFIDLDHFKEVNDRFGHAAGDRLLNEVGQRLRRAFRAEDTVARLGGDEFVALCESVGGTKETEAIVGRVSAALAAPMSIEGQDVPPVASIGVAVTADATQKAEALIDQADTAMYQAKAQGGGRWVMVDASMEAGPAAARTPRS